MKSYQTWSIIVFAYNEEGNIIKTLDNAYKILNILSPVENELIIVDDGSDDNTPHLIETFSKNKNNVVGIRHTKNRGIGPALMSGYNNATMENVCAIPADGQFNTEELLPFAEIPLRTIVSFYRKKKTFYSPFRKVLTFFNRLLNSCVFGIKIKDVNWVKVYKNEDLKSTNLAITSSLVESEICAKMLIKNKQLIEVQSIYNPRLSGKPKGAAFKIVVKALSDIFILYCEIRKFKKKLKK